MTDPAPPPASKRSAIRWQRVATYLGSIAVILMIWICATLYVIREQPYRFVHDLLAKLPFYSSTREVEWLNRRTLEIDDVKLGDFFYADSIIVTASPFGLLRRHIAKIRVNGGQVFTKGLYAAMENNTGKGGQGVDWTIGRLEISRGTVLLDHLGLDTAIPIRLGVKTPVVLSQLRLGNPDDSPEMSKEQQADIEGVNIVSPIDPVAPVLRFPLIRLKFTYTELWHHHIRQIILVRPTMFLGEDLFWFSSQFKKERNALPEQGVTAPWEIDHFEVQYGQLAINAFGQPVVQLPFFFVTNVNNIRLDQLDKISAKSTIAIKRLDQDYPDYKIQLTGLTGQLDFSLPPSDKRSNNVVNTFAVEEISWNKIPVRNVSSTVTFDPNGVYGKLYGKCEGGDLTGNFEFYYTKGFTWNANLFADKVNCQPIAEKMGGRYVDLTGELDGKLAVQGRTTEILDCQGLLTLPGPGVLQIKSLADLMNRLPADASALKKQAMKLAITNFQTYPYTSGQVKIAYKPAGGVGTLQLNSPLGQRQFEMYWHPYDAAGSSKVANNGDNQ